MSSMRASDAALAWMMVCVFSLALIVLVGASYHYQQLGPYTDMSIVKQRYAKCKAEAPEGMDCVMVPMMVSNDVAKKVGQKP